MTFRKFAFNNVFRNKRLYLAYFLSCMFTVMVFFTFSIFAHHPELSADRMNDNVTSAMNTSAGIIYVFSFFFVLYSMSSFLQSRKKEFGLLMLQGMSMRQIRRMVFLENMMIGFMATIGGILLGLVFAKLILLLAENVLILENKLYFYFPSRSILLTLIAFVILFFCISLFVSYVLRSRKLIELMKADKQSKGEPKANRFLTVVAILLLGVGYACALIVKGLAVALALIPVVIVVTIGTYFLFTQLSVYIIRWLKQREEFFWRNTNMLLFSDLSFRMKDNARTFFMVAIVSTVSFCAIGSLFGTQSYIENQVKTMNPYTFSYREYDKTLKEAEMTLIQETLRAYGITADEAAMNLSYYEVEGGEKILIVKQSDFNRFASLLGENPIELADGEVIAVEYQKGSFGQTHEQTGRAIHLTSGETLHPERVIYSRALPEMAGYYVISDSLHEHLPKSVDDYYHIWLATDGQQQTLDAAKKLYAEIPAHAFSSVDYQVYTSKKYYAPTLFVGLFIGLVFFVSAGSFLYFRLYMDLDGDKQKFQAIGKLGLSDQELKKVLTRQIAILFFAPIVVALIHGAVALTALSHMFFHNLFVESVTVLGVFLLIQIVYFFIVRYFYTAQIKADIG